MSVNVVAVCNRLRCLAQERWKKLEYLLPQRDLLSEEDQQEVAFAATWFGPLSTAAKLKYIVASEDSEKKMGLAKAVGPELHLRLRALCVKEKTKQKDVDMFMQAAEFVQQYSEHLTAIQDHVHPTCKAPPHIVHCVCRALCCAPSCPCGVVCCSCLCPGHAGRVRPLVQGRASSRVHDPVAQGTGAVEVVWHRGDCTAAGDVV